MKKNKKIEWIPIMGGKLLTGYIGDEIAFEIEENKCLRDLRLSLEEDVKTKEYSVKSIEEAKQKAKELANS